MLTCWVKSDSFSREASISGNLLQKAIRKRMLSKEEKDRTQKQDELWKKLHHFYLEFNRPLPRE